VFAIQLAKVGILEKDRAPYQHLIDAAISKAVLAYVQARPAGAVTLPIVAKLPA
jgi:hypothetical protein